jgi:hypothetical protein
MKIWEVHSLSTNGAIRTTADGDADVAGLLLTEKAYLLAMRDFRPAQLLNLVHERGQHGAAEALVAHFAGAQPDNTGRTLSRGRSRMGDPVIQPSDEAPQPVTAGRLAPGDH